MTNHVVVLVFKSKPPNVVKRPLSLLMVIYLTALSVRIRHLFFPMLAGIIPSSISLGAYSDLFVLDKYIWSIVLGIFQSKYHLDTLLSLL